MPGFCVPWPGNSSAMGPMSFTPMSPASGPLQEAGAPRQTGTEAGQQDVVAALDTSLADRLFERQRDRRARRVAVLVDVDRDPLQGQADPPRGGVDDAVVRLVRNPEVDVLEGHAGLLAHLVRLSDEDVDRELEDVGTDHVDVRLSVLRRVRAFLDVAAGDLRVSAAGRAQTPAEKSRAPGG